MALVSCPVCGRKNVSDSADRCPSCNIPVAAYLKARPDFGKERPVTKCEECELVIKDDFLSECPSCGAKIPGRNLNVTGDFTHPMCPKCDSRKTDMFDYDMKRHFFIGTTYFVEKYWCMDCGHLFTKAKG